MLPFILACRLLHYPDVPAATKQQLSSCLADLFIKLLQTAAAQQAQQPQEWLKSGCSLFLRATTRSPEFQADPLLPLLPKDATAVLHWVDTHLIDSSDAAGVVTSGTRGSGNQGSYPTSNGHVAMPHMPDTPFAASATVGGRGGVVATANGVAPLPSTRQQSPGHASNRQLLNDDKIYLLISKLVITASTSVGYSRLGVSAGQLPDDIIDGDKSSLPDPLLLCRLLTWSCSRVKVALQRLLQPAGN